MVAHVVVTSTPQALLCSNHTHSTRITRLELLQQCRKRAADEPSESLRRIFDEETRNAGEASDTVGFGLRPALAVIPPARTRLL